MKTDMKMPEGSLAPPRRLCFYSLQFFWFGVGSIKEKVLDGFQSNLVERWGMVQGRSQCSVCFSSYLLEHVMYSRV